MNEQIQNIQTESEESSIDFGAIWQAVKSRRRLYYIALPVAFVLAAVYTLSLPNYYNCQVKLSPELSSRRTGNSLATLASSFGVNIGSAGATGTEALFPTLYPDLMNSVDFKTSLFPVPVTIEGKDKGEPSRTLSYYDYLKNEQKAPWWSAAIKGIFSIFSSDKKDEVKEINPFRLTKVQAAIVKAIDHKVVCDVDKKTMVITINVTDQDPYIAACMADTVQHRLQDFIAEYRTKKARVDLEYNRKLYKEAKARYDKARQLYAEYADANQDMILQSARTKLVNLENEMQLQYNAYNAIAQQLTAAEAKVQEETPAFTTLQSATVPVVKAGPKRAQMCLIFVFLAFLGTTVWILYKEKQLKPLLGLS